jgi:hypothetical protein
MSQTRDQILIVGSHGILEIFNLVHEFLSKDSEGQEDEDPRHAEKRAED